MRKCIYLILFYGILCTLLTSCSVPKPPQEKDIIKELSEDITTVFIGNPFDELNPYVHKMNVNSVSIEKRQTNGKEDIAYCIVELENEYYQFTKYLKMDYNYYDKGGWILDSYSEYKDMDWKLIGCPLAVEDIAYVCNYSQIQYKETVNELEDGLITFCFDVEEPHKNGVYRGMAAICCQFDGKEWSYDRNIEDVHFIEDSAISQNNPVGSEKLASYIGKTVGDVKRDFGTDYEVAYFEAGPYISYDTGNAFAVGFCYVRPEEITDDIVISSVATTNSNYAVYNFSGTMTYPEIAEAVSGEITLDLPEYYPDLDILDSPWDYFLSFKYRGYNLGFGWFDDPETTRSNVLLLGRLDFNYEVYQNSQPSEDGNSQPKVSTVNHSPFYGIWCGAVNTDSAAQKYAETVRGNGFEAQVFVTTDWSNLNPTKYYVIAAGVYSSKAEASAALPNIKTIYPDAYIKYSGNWQRQD